MLNYLLLVIIFWIILFALLRAMVFVTKRSWKKDLQLTFFQAILLTVLWMVMTNMME
ncbi:hypothetical protein [Alkalicoccus daliensis]|uniref:Uncharacterized protein n=1 Tax=Alkalicoccus daliensis TaxID=745820 RepID=A0A1H0I062_9BACI|nr:hypothetical protein [Alkalicoccus daliensis]SDO24530.1 hypothetical protein SAMN04488053_109109 [Alkalicoccus daliensis]